MGRQPREGHFAHEAQGTESTNVIIFGAGASYGSGSAKPDVPPLTPGLMTALAAAHPSSWGRLPEELQTLFENDFEAGMTRLGVARPDLLPPLQRAMAQFFFRYTPGRDNLYRDLGRRMGEAAWNGVLVTLNYERLLQLSLEAEGVQPIIGSSGHAGSAVEVCLPHGSCQLFCDGIVAAASGVEFAGMEVETGGTAIVIDDPGEFARRIVGDSFPPVMSYFDPAKATTSCVNFIMEQRARYRDLVTEADRVAIVGVAVRPSDHHLWQPLAESAAEIAFCAGEAAVDGFREWAGSNRLGRVNHAYPTYFAESFDELCEAVGL